MRPDHATSHPDIDILRELSVLYVEDEETTREQLTSLLTRKVAAVHTAADGEQGLAAFLRHRPDIVLSDIEMPRMNGLRMAEAIKRISPHTPVIIATAFKDSDLLLQAISLDIDKFLVKPIGKPQLLEALLGCARVLHAERRRLASEAKYRMMMEQAADGIFISAPDGRYLDVNPKGCRMIGYSREEILRFNIRDLLPSERHEGLAQGIELILSGQPVLAETQLRHKDGGLVDVEISGGLLGNGTIMATVRDISVRKKMESSLRKSKASLKRAQRIAHVGNWEIDLKSGKLSWSDETYRILGFEPNKIPISYDLFIGMVHPEDRQLVNIETDLTLTRKTPHSIDFRIIRPNGAIRHVQGTAEVSAADGDGDITLLFGTLQDITALKHAEQALLNSHETFATVLDGMDALVYVADMQTHEILFANRCARVAIGTELLGKICWKTLQVGQTGPCAFCTNDRLLSPDGSAAGVHVWEFRNTVNQRWYLIRDQAIRWTDGRYVRMEIATDITERKEMEEALRLSESSLTRAQRLAHLGNWEWRIRQGMVSYSEETARIAGLAFPPGECAIEEFLKPTHPGDKIMVLRAINAALFNNQPYDLEYRITAQGGEIRHVRNLGEVERDEGGEPVTLLGTMQDVTERKQLEESILGISEKTRSEIGLELHDGLGQQLTGIGFVGKMLENKLTGQALPEAADAARIVQAVAEAINQTRSLARGLYPVELAENGLIAALEQLAHNTRVIFGIECTFKSLDPMVAYKNETAIHLYRIAQEAINNAVKHGKADCILVSLLPDDDGIHLSVADNGIGLDRSSLTNPRGMGLRIMEYRASLIGATLNIWRSSQGGTIVSVR